MHHPCGFHSSELLIKPLEGVDQLLVIDTQLVKDSRQVASRQDPGLSGSPCRGAQVVDSLKSRPTMAPHISDSLAALREIATSWLMSDER